MTPSKHAARRVVLVSGPPAAGKSSIAGPLATALELPLFSKDQLKETLTDAFAGPSTDLAYSRRIGGASMELLWSLAARVPGCVLDANFRPRSEYEHSRILGLDARIVEVHCVCDPAELTRRFAARAAAGMHPAHPLTELPAELLAEYDQPMNVGPVVRVNTMAPVDVEALAGEVQCLWAR
jgi:predicted kinase